MTAEALISAPRDVHRRLRRQLAHAFSDSALLQQKAVIKRYTDRLLDRIQEQSQQEDIIDIVKWSKAATTDIIGDLTFSKPFGFIANSVHSPWVFSIFDSLREAIYRRAMQSFPLVNLLSTTLNINPFQSSINLVRRGVKEIAKQRLQLGQLATDERRDFMAYMMEDSRSGGAGMSADEILENSPSIIIAGSETTATALSGFWFYLSKHPDVYKTLAKEIRTSFCSEHEITMQRAAALEYLGACINEILRVYPPAAETPARVSPGDWFDGTYIPAGTLVSVYQWATFRNPEHFAESDSFIPERWLAKTHERYDDRFANDNRTVFKPFSFGPRDCLGKNLAIRELRFIISRFLYRFDYRLCEGQDDWHSQQRTFIVWERSPLYLSLTPLRQSA